jgi:hypothetical protein
MENFCFQLLEMVTLIPYLREEKVGVLTSPHAKTMKN